jgi:hypothetical protein
MAILKTLLADTSCAPQPTAEPASSAWHCARYGNGAHTASVALVLPAALICSSSAALVFRLPCSFQLPTTSFGLAFTFLFRPVDCQINPAFYRGSKNRVNFGVSEINPKPT